MEKAHRAPSRPPSPHFYCFRSSTTTTTATTKAVLLFFHVHKNIVVYGQLCANFMGNTNRNIFWCLLCRRNFFFFQFSNRVHPYHLYHQNTGNGFNACVWSKKKYKTWPLVLEFVWCEAGAQRQFLKVFAQEEKLDRRRGPILGESGGMLPQKSFRFSGS